MIRRYGNAVLFVLAAFVSTLALQHHYPYPFLFLFFAAVMASAWFGGAGAGLCAVVISTALVDYFFIPPFHSLSINATEETYFLAFILCSLVTNWISSAKKKSEEELKKIRDQLEIRVSERTAALLQTQAELARYSRMMSMDELTASIAHEINQPITAVVTHSHACREWLSADPPNLEKARQTAERIIQDGARAGAVLSRIRALFKKEPPARDWLDMNELIRELAILLRDEASRQSAQIRLRLSEGLPKIKGDRVQLQQVLLNLAMNGMEAMANISRPMKELTIRSSQQDDRVLIEIADHGVGLTAETAEKIFQPFFTTKAQGIGMGLSISRSIIEAHEGQLWAANQPAGGALFLFTLPLSVRDSDD